MSVNNNQIEDLLKENKRLREDNETLLNIVVQMKVTLNRLVSHYVTEQTE